MTALKPGPVDDGSLRERSRFRAAIDRLGVVGCLCVVVLVSIVLLAVLGPVLNSHSPYSQNLVDRLQGPSGGHWLGTDQYGRDVLARLSLGLRTTLWVATASTTLALFIGTALGAGSAYLGGKIDTIFAGILDILLVFPTLLLGMMLMVAFGTGSWQLILTATIVLAVRFARVARAHTYSLKGQEFIEAARASGKSRTRVVVSDLMPNVLPHNFGLATYWFDRAVGLEAGLSFLGIGIAPPSASIGVGLREGLGLMFNAPHLLAIYAGLLAILIVTLSLLADRLLNRGQ